jgi:hypothetical protein
MDSMSVMIAKVVEEQVKIRMEAEIKSRVESEMKTRTYMPAPKPVVSNFDPERFVKIAFTLNGETDMWSMVKLAYQSSPERFSVYGTSHANLNSNISDCPQKVTVRWTMSEKWFIPIHFYGNTIPNGAFMVESADICLNRKDPAVYLGNLCLAKTNWKAVSGKISGSKSTVSS